MKRLIMAFSVLCILGVAYADVTSPRRGGDKYNRRQAIQYNLPIPCDTTEAYALSANQTPVVVQLTPSVSRRWTIMNRGGAKLRYTTSQFGLPPNWDTLYVEIPALGNKEVNLSNIQQVWVWHSEATTPVPAAIGCFAINSTSYAPTLTITLTSTPTPTFTPTMTPTATPTVTP